MSLFHQRALSGQNMPPATLSKREKKLHGAPYFGMPCKIYELFRLVSFTANYGGYAYIRITPTIFKSAWFWINTMVNISLFGSIGWFCEWKALIKTLGTSWLGLGPVEWVRDELKVLNGFNIRNNYRFIWSNLVILWLQSTFNEFGDQLTGLGTSWMG